MEIADDVPLLSRNKYRNCKCIFEGLTFGSCDTSDTDTAEPREKLFPCQEISIYVTMVSFYILLFYSSLSLNCFGRNRSFKQK